MWQRFRDAVDTRIQEEQARQKASSPRPSTSATRPRSDSSRRRPAPRKDGSPAVMPTGKEPDPSEFEPEFVIGEEGDTPAASGAPSRVGTPAVPAIKVEGEAKAEAKADAKEASEEGKDGEAKGEGAAAAADTSTIELSQPSPDIQARLRKLDRLEPKYAELLKSYRIAHARNKFIEPFEAALRENTPLTSITEPTALVEYLNQSNLKTSMVMEEMKRLATERDDLKKMLEESVKESKAQEQELDKLRAEKAGGEESKKDVTPKGNKVTTDGDGDDFFSYESELPRLQEEVQQYEAKLEKLQEENEGLKNDVTSAKESAERLARDLVASTRELQTIRERGEKNDAKNETTAALQATVDELNRKLKAADEERAVAESNRNLLLSLQKDKETWQKQLEDARVMMNQSKDQDLNILRDDLEESKHNQAQAQKRASTLEKLLETLRGQLKAAEEEKGEIVEERDATYLRLQGLLDRFKTDQDTRNAAAETNGASTPSTATPAETTNGASAAAGGKKKNKKKKKGAANAKLEVDPTPGTPGEPTDEVEQDSGAHEATITELRGKLEDLTKELEAKDVSIDRLEKKLKDQEALQEEIESLRDDLRDFGAEHVEVKDKLKEALAAKTALQKTITELEKELAEMKTSHATNAGDRQKHESLTAEFAELKGKADALQSDLEAAQKLAAGRFKELSDLREIMQKAQPELTSLRTEVAELRKSKVELAARNTEVRRLEAREKDLRKEIERFTGQIKEKDGEIRALNEKLGQGNSQRNGLEEQLRKVQRDLAMGRAENLAISEAREKAGVELSRSRVDLGNARETLGKLEQQVKKLDEEARRLREELELKTAQYASAQSLMNSMTDQSQELSAQMKEVRERCESLEEELSDAHRLLSERSREGETMRRLLNESDGRAEARIKEMRDRMDIAIEERDRAEEQASSMGRRRVREMDELKQKSQEAQRALTAAVEEREALSRAEAALRRQKEELENRIAGEESEVRDVRQAMSQLREALDETEKQVRELEREKGDLKKLLDETKERLEKVQASSKRLADDLKLSKIRTTIEPTAASSRSSLESSRSPSRLGSPIPPGPLGNKGRIGSIAGSDAGGGGGGRDMGVDYVYLKNVLLQFLEQRDKKHQMQLIPVLGMLLHFDKKDEQRWVSAVGGR